jgi:DeoR family transcriptional regulator of aga operon
MARHAREIIVVADSSKIGMVSPAIICPVADIDLLITDEGIADHVVGAFAKCGVKVLCV